MGGGANGPLFGGPQPPSLEEFRDYGAANVASRFQDADAQTVAAYIARALGFVGGIGLAVAAGTVAGIIDASLTAGSALIAAIVVGVIQGINIFTAAAIPGKLDEAVSAAQATPDLTQLITTDTGLRELYAAFLLATLPDYPASGGVSAQQVNGRAFEFDPGSFVQVSATSPTRRGTAPRTRRI